MTTSPESAPVRIEQLATTDGHIIGRLTLDHPGTLNALTPAIVAALASALDAWATDPAIVAVLMDSSSDKAFSAGANLQAMYRAIRTDDAVARDAATLAFFAPEYRLDHVIHHYPKPVIAWMHGIVMGGGVGLACGASHRVVTATTKFAMPEIAIGLFPDVGGSWFLQRMPARIGRYLALTGARLGPADTIALGMADLPIAHERKADVIAALVAASWGNDAAGNRSRVDGVLQGAADWSTLPAADFMAHLPGIAAVANTASPEMFLAAITSAAASDPWFEPHRQALVHGSPRLGSALVGAAGSPARRVARRRAPPGTRGRDGLRRRRRLRRRHPGPDRRQGQVAEVALAHAGGGRSECREAAAASVDR